jgi:hypothetical protein
MVCEHPSSLVVKGSIKFATKTSVHRGRVYEYDLTQHIIGGSPELINDGGSCADTRTTNPTRSEDVASGNADHLVMTVM